MTPASHNRTPALYPDELEDFLEQEVGLTSMATWVLLSAAGVERSLDANGSFGEDQVADLAIIAAG